MATTNDEIKQATARFLATIGERTHSYDPGDALAEGFAAGYNECAQERARQAATNPEIHRPQVSDERIRWAITEFTDKLRARLNEKGNGSFASWHEALGSITEEYIELINAIHANDGSARRRDECNAEALDLAVACVFARACNYAPTVM
jgi:hypothetical protein